MYEGTPCAQFSRVSVSICTFGLIKIYQNPVVSETLGLAQVNQKRGSSCPRTDAERRICLGFRGPESLRTEVGGIQRMFQIQVFGMKPQKL